MAYGLTADGFVPKTIEIIREEINDAMRALFGTSIDVSDGSALGQFIGVFAEREALVWELAEQLYNAQNPDAATGTALDALCALTGTTREAATRSIVALILTGTPATVVPAGNRAANGVGDVFETLADATIGALGAWTASTAYTVGQGVTNASRVYRCTTAGTSAGSGGPTTDATDITDGSAHWRYLGEGTGLDNVTAQAVNTGPTVAVAYDITEIITPVSGWQSVTNLLDAETGTDVETDEDLRLRREDELAAAATSPIDAVRADLLDVDGVDAVTVFMNTTDATDSDGIPPHAIEPLVQGGDDQDIFDQLLASVAAGIVTYGNTTGTAEDSAGVSHAVAFTRPTEKPIYIIINVDVDEDTFPDDGDDQIKAAIVAYGDALPTGRDVRASAISAQSFGVTGVLGVSSCLIGLVDPPMASTTIAIGLRELATYDTSRIVVNVTEVTP